MKLTEVIQRLNAVRLNVPDENTEICRGYTGDFLSFVMGRAPEGCCWLTVMNNVNVIAVATLANVGAVVFCEGVKPDETALAKAKEKGVTLIGTDYDAYSAVRVLSGLTPEGL